MMPKVANPGQIEAYVKAAVARLVESGLSTDDAQVKVSQVLTKRAEELGLAPPAGDELTAQDVVVGQAYNRLIESGMDAKTAEAKLDAFIKAAVLTTGPEASQLADMQQAKKLKAMNASGKTKPIPPTTKKDPVA